MIFRVLLLLSLTGCTDAGYDALIGAYNENFSVVCYSGGQKIYEATTTGKVLSLDGGGWAFRTTDDEFVKTFADCFVSYKK